MATSSIEHAKAIQRILRDAGLYAGEIDAIIGPKTRAAWDALLVNVQKERSGLPPSGGIIPDAVDARSEGNIKTLHPKVQPLARKLVTLAASKGIVMVVTSGTRTAEEQNALYEIGRSRPNDEGKWETVTDARAWQSNHNYGIAFDLTEFVGGKPRYESADYRAVGALGKTLGLSWGGDWGWDEPHFALRPAWAEGLTEALMMKGLRERHAAGQDVFS